MDASHNARHPLKAGRDAARLWVAAALTSTVSLAAFLGAAAFAATASHATALVCLCAAGAVLCLVRSRLRKRAWARVLLRYNNPRQHPRNFADTILVHAHDLMAVLAMLAILSLNPPNLYLAGVVAALLGSGLVAVGMTRLAKEAIRATFGSGRSHAARIWGDAQPAIAGATILWFVVSYVPQANEVILFAATMTVVTLAMFAAVVYVSHSVLRSPTSGNLA